MPTGSGKTTGAIWGLVKLANERPNLRLCFMTKYTEAVDKVHAELVARLGEDIVGYYHAEAFVTKQDELAKRFLVITHNFIAHNRGKLDDCDLFVVDEAIYATGQASLSLQDIISVRSWATINNIKPDVFNELGDLAVDLDNQLRISGKKYIAATYNPDRAWANFKTLIGVQRFCEALLEGLVFLNQGKKREL